MFQVGTFQHFAKMVKGGGQEGSRGTHTFWLARMSHSKNGKSVPIHIMPLHCKFEIADLTPSGLKFIHTVYKGTTRKVLN